MKVEFFVSGIPLPQPRPRARAVRVGANHIAQVYNPKTTDGWKKMIWVYAMQNRLPQQFSEHFYYLARVWMVFQFPRPQHHFGTGMNAGVQKKSAPIAHTIRPDLDNLAKPVLDALTDSGVFWKDDGAVCELHLGKRYAQDPGVLITISSEQQ
jgi:Holliday junction resolvase RusA-like endonuclease